MARYNSVNTISSVAGGTSISTPYSGLLTTLTGSGTVNLPNPVLYAGSSQTFYNSTGSTITLSSSPAFIVGPGIAGSSTTVSLSGGAVITLVSDGANYVAQAWLGGAAVTTSLTATGGTINGVSIGATTTSTGAFTTLSAGSTTTLAGGSASGVFSFTSAQASSATNNGAIIVAGGAGIGGAVYVGGLVSVQTATPSVYAAMDVSGAQSAIIFPKGTTAQRPGILSSTTASAGMTRFNITTNYLEYYDGTNWNSISAPPTISNISPTSFNAAGATITINGSLFAATAIVTLVDKLNSVISIPSITFVNSTQITFQIPATAAADGKDPFNVVVTNPSGLSATLAASLFWNAAPTSFSPAAGSLATVYDSSRSGYSYPQITATSPDPGATLGSYAIASGSIPPGLTFNANGTFSGTANAVGSNTVYSFTVSAVATSFAGNTYPGTSGTYSITILAPIVVSFTGTGGGAFTVPTGVNNVQVLVVAAGASGGFGNVNEGGGGGGAGGVVYASTYPVTPGGSVPLSVGVGMTAPGSPGGGPPTGNQAGASTFGSITANGGGSGGYGQTGQNGGSGGGGSGFGQDWAGGSATQGPSGPGTGYGNPGGSGHWSGNGNNGAAGGGGGAGGAGSGAPTGNPGASGGPGISISITGSAVSYGAGGTGGYGRNQGSPAVAGANNTGNGGTGGNNATGPQPGGPGVVIVRY
jgi:hypothetical protein